MMFKVICIGIASSLPFLFTLHGDFVFDDSEAVVKNKDVISDSWKDAFYNDFWGTNIKSNLSHKSYRPLTTLSFRFNYYLNHEQLAAYQFKIINLICHIVCSLLVWQTFQCILHDTRLRRQTRTGCDTADTAALLYAVHPVHVEAVCGIVGRADILAGLTFYLAFLFYNKSLKTSCYKYLYLSCTVLLAAISMLFKENGITILGFCMVYELVLNIKFPFTTKMKNAYKKMHIHLNSASLLRIIFLVLSSMLLLYGRWIVMGGSKPEFNVIDNPASFAKNFFTRVATYNYIYFLNLLLFIWPQWLCYDWSMGCVPLIQDPLDYRILFILAMYLYGLAAAKVLISSCWRKSTMRLLILAVSLMLIPFLPAANIFFPVGFVIAERVLYIPSAGYCLLFAIGFHKIINVSRRKKICIFFFYFLLLLFGMRSWHRSREWQDEYRLFISGLSVCPDNAKVRYNVAKVADAKGLTAWALDEYKEAIRLNSEYYQAMNNLANLLKNQKQYTEAETYLKTAVNLKRDFPAAWMNLGIVLASLKRYDEAISAYKTALEYRKKYPDCFYNLGNLYLEVNKTEDAIKSWYNAINQNSSHTLAWTNLLALLDNSGQLQTALEVIPKALAALPNSPSINFAIANIYGKLERYSEAEYHFKKAIKLFKSNIQAIHFANLGVLYHRWRKYDQAEEMYRSALKIDPHFRSARKNLQLLQKNNVINSNK